jgi:hypothetical protein
VKVNSSFVGEGVGASQKVIAATRFEGGFVRRRLYGPWGWLLAILVVAGMVVLAWQGHKIGYTKGEAAGREAGREEGRASGYSEGYAAGAAGRKDAYRTGYTAGDAAGRKAGYTTGYATGQAAVEPQVCVQPKLECPPLSAPPATGVDTRKRDEEEEDRRPPEPPDLWIRGYPRSR